MITASNSSSVMAGSTNSTMTATPTTSSGSDESMSQLFGKMFKSVFGGGSPDKDLQFKGHGDAMDFRGLAIFYVLIILGWQ